MHHPRVANRLRPRQIFPEKVHAAKTDDEHDDAFEERRSPIDRRQAHVRSSSLACTYSSGGGASKLISASVRGCVKASFQACSAWPGKPKRASSCPYMGSFRIGCFIAAICTRI